MNWQPVNTAPKDGAPFIARVTKAVWSSGREDGPFITSIRWNGYRWVLADIFLEDARLTVSWWMPRVQHQQGRA